MSMRETRWVTRSLHDGKLSRLSRMFDETISNMCTWTRCAYKINRHERMLLKKNYLTFSFCLDSRSATASSTFKCNYYRKTRKPGELNMDMNNKNENYML